MAGKYDVIIIGGGPSGMTAAIYAARDGLKTVIIEKIAVGGQIFITDMVENYPGIEKISGPLLIRTMEKQALHFGAEIVSDEIEKISDIEGGLKEVKGASGGIFTAKAVIIAAGAKYKELGVTGEDKFRGRGVSNCATCDGAFYKNMEVAVVGGGDTAVEESDFLTRFASKVYIIHRRGQLRASKIIQEKAFKNQKLNFIYDTVVEEIAGDKSVELLKLKNVKTGEKSGLAVKGIFVLVGFDPLTSFVKGYVDMTEQGYIIADQNMETSRKGIFACGDCTKKKLRQLVTACGDGAVAAKSAAEYIEKLKG